METFYKSSYYHLPIIPRPAQATEPPKASKIHRIRRIEPPTATILLTFITSSIQSLQTSNSRVSKPRRPGFFKQTNPVYQGQLNMLVTGPPGASEHYRIRYIELPRATIHTHSSLRVPRISKPRTPDSPSHEDQCFLGGPSRDLNSVTNWASWRLQTS